uniref:Zinc finger HIT domain-containing protein 3 n=2 Tax=Cacopsylla melanoneura TaxID=428564 RepID=A0A8D8ZPK9_9HEMI
MFMWVKSRKVEKCWKLLENSTSFLEKQKKAVIFLDNWIEIPITYLLHNRNITLNLKHHYQYLIRKKGVYVVTYQSKMFTCEICQEKEKKYKCPNCEIVYCSVQCFQTHKESCTTIKLSDANHADTTEGRLNENNDALEEETAYQFPTKHTVPLEKLKLLGTNEHLKSLLANPHLQSILTALTKTRNIQHAMSMVMLEPIFVEFSVECLRTVEEVGQGEEDLDSAELKQFVSQIKQLADNAG